MLYVSVLFPLPGRMGMEPSQSAFLGCEVQMCGNYEELCYLCFEAHCFLHMGFAHRNIFNCAEAQPDIAGWSSLVARRAQFAARRSYSLRVFLLLAQALTGLASTRISTAEWLSPRRRMALQQVTMRVGPRRSTRELYSGTRELYSETQEIHCGTQELRNTSQYLFLAIHDTAGETSFAAVNLVL